MRLMQVGNDSAAAIEVEQEAVGGGTPMLGAFFSETADDQAFGRGADSVQMVEIVAAPLPVPAANKRFRGGLRRRLSPTQ